MLQELLQSQTHNNTLSSYVKEMRKQFGLTQVDLAAKSGVGLRFVRELEQGKETLRLDKVNQVLLLFGQEIGPVPIRKEESVN
ncbi:helix-turn-helix transcriptional regulator [Segatella copri]